MAQDTQERIDQLLDKVDDLKDEIEKLKDDVPNNVINTGIGTIEYTTNGSIDLQELMDIFGECIKGNDVRTVIRILDAAK